MPSTPPGLSAPPGLTLPRNESFAYSEMGSECGRAITVATQSTTGSDPEDSESSLPNSGANSPKSSVSARVTKVATPTPEVVDERPHMVLDLSAALGAMDVQPPVAKNDATKGESAVQAKPGKKKDAKKLNKSGTVPAEEVTTLMIRGIPCSFSQQALTSMLNDAGLKDKYDFFYLPRDGQKNSNLGYAFVNFVDVKSAEHCSTLFEGVQLDPFRSPKTCRISPGAIQGLPGLWDHFRNTAVSCGSNGPQFLNVKGKSQARHQKNKPSKGLDARR